jgi:hypothetical protein
VRKSIGFHRFLNCVYALSEAVNDQRRSLHSCPAFDCAAPLKADEPHMEQRPRNQLTSVNLRYAFDHALFRNNPESMLLPLAACRYISRYISFAKKRKDWRECAAADRTVVGDGQPALAGHLRSLDAELSKSYLTIAW